jgi:hypothetical protein
MTNTLTTLTPARVREILALAAVHKAIDDEDQGAARLCPEAVLAMHGRFIARYVTELSDDERAEVAALSPAAGRRALRRAARQDPLAALEHCPRALSLAARSRAALQNPKLGIARSHWLDCRTIRRLARLAPDAWKQRLAELRAALPADRLAD